MHLFKMNTFSTSCTKFFKIWFRVIPFTALIGSIANLDNSIKYSPSVYQNASTQDLYHISVCQISTKDYLILEFPILRVSSW